MDDEDASSRGSSQSSLMDWLLALVLQWGSTLDELEPVMVVAHLDHVRAEAFASGRVSMLDEVYAAGSSARHSDAATIRSYRERGARVVGAELRILSWRSLRSSETSHTMRVVDQLAPSRVEWADGTTTYLPHDEPTRRTLTVVMTSDGWRLD